MAPSFVSAHPADQLLHSYCARILVFEVQNNKKIADIESAYVNKEKLRTKEIGAVRSKQNAAIVSFVEGFDKEIAAYIEDLKNSARSETVLAQLVNLNDQIYGLTRERNKKVQQLLQDYRAGINDLVVARKASFTTAENTFKNDVKKILDTSKADCKALKDVRKIFDNTTGGLKSVLEVFKGKITRMGTSQTTLNKLAVTRDAAWDAALAEYKQKVAEAINTFKTALPE
ncbi:MAG: hypothetical protein RJB39_715 [Candidatus Parcubacteria bacterium]|jgi:hypothetical protein